MQQFLPVAPLTTSTSLMPWAARELEAHELDERVVATLVRGRLQLDRARGWVLLCGLVTTSAAVVGLGVGMGWSKVLLGVLAPVVATVPFGIGLLSDRVAWLWFERQARAQGLSERASRRVFEGALGADHWIGVLASCGRPPSDAEIARFVLQGARADGAR